MNIGNGMRRKRKRGVREGWKEDDWEGEEDDLGEEEEKERR